VLFNIKRVTNLEEFFVVEHMTDRKRVKLNNSSASYTRKQKGSKIVTKTNVKTDGYGGGQRKMS
jgi:hypothetical protein